MVDEETQEGEVHPAVQLLLARMDSHPEEFKNHRWERYYETSRQHWNATEKRLFKAKIREIGMQTLHENLMKELFKEPKDTAASLTHSLYQAQANQAYLMQQAKQVQQVQHQAYLAQQASYSGTYLNTPTSVLGSPPTTIHNHSQPSLLNTLSSKP